jgi:glycosyltransferase involved in cell wall biosynthesis
MKVLLCTSERGLRGGERQVALLAAGLVARGDTVALAAPAGAALQADFPGRAFAVPMANVLDVRGVFGLRRALADFGPEVVHAFTPKAHALARWAARGEAPAPLVVTRSVVYPPGKGLWGQRRYRTGVARFIAVSSAVQAALESAGVAAEKIEVILPGVQPRPAADGAGLRAECGLGPGDFAIGSIGALEAAKGFDVGLRALAALRGQGVPAHWLFLGEGALRGALEAEARRLGVEGAAHWLGAAATPEALFGAVQAYASPSRQEGFGVALAEAMAAGLPCVACDSGGARDVLAAEQRVPSEESGALAALLARIRTDRAWADAISRAGVTRARAFTPDAMVERTRALYGTLLTRRSS